MIEQEAIAIITKVIPKKCKMVNGNLRGGYDDWDSKEGKAIRIVIDIFEKIQQYRAIGTIEECREAVEKQRAKKPINNSESGRILYNCPLCNDVLSKGNGLYRGYCACCGQRLDWRKVI